MENEYQTKDMKSSQTKMEAPKPSGMGKPEHMEDGHIFEKEGLFLFNWKGGQCGFGSREAAELGLEKVSGNAR
jgi:hypothetical protein